MGEVLCDQFALKEISPLKFRFFAKGHSGDPPILRSCELDCDWRCPGRYPPPPLRAALPLAPLLRVRRSAFSRCFADPVDPVSCRASPLPRCPASRPAPRMRVVLAPIAWRDARAAVVWAAPRRPPPRPLWLMSPLLKMLGSPGA
jgi:hypothetical protein